LVEHT